MKIRPATTGDLEGITSLEAEAFPSPWKQEFFEGELVAPGRFSLVAADETGFLLGYLFAMYFFDEMHINKIAVAMSSRRRGIATRLMDECLQFARKSGVREISLEVRNSNLPAQQFYRRLAFQPVYTRERYYPDGESAIVMSTMLE